MRIAVQLFGHLRTFNKCYPTLQRHLLSKYECDIFMHTWSTMDHSTVTWHKNKMWQANKSTKNLVNELTRIYGLKKIKVEDQNVKDLGNMKAVGRDISIFGVQSMFHSMKEVNRLREEYQVEYDKKYDFIITLRPDIFFKKDFIIEDFIKRLEQEELDNTVFTAGYPMAGLLSDFKYLGATDVLFFARPSVLTKMYQNEDIFLNYFKADMIVNYGPEYYFSKTIEQNGFRAVLIKYIMGNYFEIQRPKSAQSIRKSILSIRLRKNFLKIQMLSIMPIQIVRLRVNLGGGFFIYFSIGLVGEEENNC